MASKRRRITLLRKIIYTSITCFLVLFLLEATVRGRAWYRYGKSTTKDYLYYDSELDLRYPFPGSERKGSKTSWKINSLGFRGDEMSVEKPPRTVRIACLGASTTFCGEASSNATAWPHQLQTLLQAEYPQTRIEVINAGVPGYRITHSLKNLTTRVLPLQPDVVILYHANNDIVSDTRHVAKARKLLSNAESGPNLITWVSHYSMLVDLAQKNIKIKAGRANTQSGKLSEIPADLPKQFVANLNEIHEVLKKNNIVLILSAFQVKYRRDQPRHVQIANADVAFYYMPWMSIEGMLDAVDVYNQAIVGYAQAQGVLVLTETDRFPADDVHFADCMHLSDRGCQSMARRFADFIVEQEVVADLLGRVPGDLSSDNTSISESQSGARQKLPGDNHRE